MRCSKVVLLSDLWEFSDKFNKKGSGAMSIIQFKDYSNKYSCIQMERHDGILQMTLHTNGSDLKWGISAHEELSYGFYDIARDHENRCIILTGAGHSFCEEFEGDGGPGGISITGRGERQPAGLKST